MEEGHLPVLAEEVVVMLAPVPGSLQIDATVGGGGHSERILEATSPTGRLLGLDADAAAIARVRRRLRRYADRIVLRRANFRDLGTVAAAAGFGSVDGVLFDLGLSSQQLADRRRGFGFRTGGPLDMRYDTRIGRPAGDLVNGLSRDDLASLFRRYGEEPVAGRIASAIVRARAGRPIETAEQLAALCAETAPVPPPGRRAIHPATRVFQALRIAVNDELGALEAGLAAALGLLRPGGRVAVIAYHSLEDRTVKRFFAAERRGCTCPPQVPVCVCGRAPRVRLLAARPIRPTVGEIQVNPRSRSARLRAAERLAA
jgi:16S rRNA (cytosine1402-N4)-methyltransferase